MRSLVLAGSALVLALTPLAAHAQRGGGHGGGSFHSAAGGFSGRSSIGSAHVSGSFGYHGGYGYRGSYGYRGGYGGHGYYYPGYRRPGFLFGLGFYYDPFFYGYPPYGYYSYYSVPYDYYDGPAYTAPADVAPPPPPPSATSNGQQNCGNWQWDAGAQRYKWVTQAC